MNRKPDDFYLGRQPIVDRQRRVVAYELLHRCHGAAQAHIDDDARATLRVMQRAFGELGVTTVLGHAHGFINVDAELLMSGRIECLPQRHVVLELLETIRVDAAVVARCRALKRLGYRLALDDFNRYSDAYRPLLALADIVKVDVLGLERADLVELVHHLAPYPARLLAEKVDSVERARHCLALGFELFQGFLFGRPTAVPA